MTNNFKTLKTPAKIISMLLIMCVMLSSINTVIALDDTDVSDLIEQTYVLNPEKGVSVTLSGCMPENGRAEAVPEDVEGEDVLHAYDISIYYSDGREFEPEEGSPIDVSFRSELIAEAIDDSFTTIQVEHITDSGKEESIIPYSVDDNETAFEAESFSVYVIRTHTEKDENLNPRKTFHFLSPDFTSETIDDKIYYHSGSYYFPNKLNEQVCTQTVRNGESLQQIVLPDNDDESGLFYGWYEVHMTEENNGIYTYYWGSEEPHHVPFNEPIEVGDKDEDVYLAPLFGHYRFLTFHQDVEGSENEDTIVTRKLVTLGADRKCNITISDVRAPSSNPNRIVFWGWKFTHRDDGSDSQSGVTETIQTVTTSGNEIPASILIEDTVKVANHIQLTEEDLKRMIFDIWPVFKEARWVSFDTNATGSGVAYVQPQFIMIDEPPIGFGNVPERTGFKFLGWWYKKNGKNVQITDENANVLDKVEEVDTGVSVQNGKLVMTHDSEELELVAEWAAADTAKFHVIVWKQKITDDKDLTDDNKSYDYYHSYELEGNTDTDATKTDAYVAGEFEDIVNSTLAKELDENLERRFIGFEYKRTEVTDNEEGTEGSQVNPNGSTIVNVYYDRQLMTITYKYPRTESSYMYGNADGYEVYSYFSNYTYIPTVSNDGEQYGYFNSRFVSLTADITQEGSYIFPYKYIESDNELDTMYGKVEVGDTGKYEYVTVNKVIDQNNIVYTLTRGNSYILTTDNTSDTQYGIYNDQIVNVYYGRNSRRDNYSWWLNNDGWRPNKYYNEYFGNRYISKTNSSTDEYTGQRYKIVDNAFVETDDIEDTDGTLYAYVDGYYIPLTLSGNVTYKYTYNGADYTGTRYERDTDNEGYTGDIYEKSGSEYVISDNGSGIEYGIRNNTYEELDKLNENVYNWKVQSTGDAYTGTRYLRFATVNSGDNPYEVVWTGLYGQSFSKYHYAWPGNFTWKYSNSGSTTTLTMLAGFTVLNKEETSPITDLVLTGSAASGNITMYHLRQKLDGTYSTESTAYYSIAYVSSGGKFTLSNKFDGFTAWGYSTQLHEDGNGVTEAAEFTLSSGDTYYVYHERLSVLEFVFDDNCDNGHTVVRSNIKFEQPLNNLEGVYEPTRPNYIFTGWYEDKNCTKLFDFNSLMPDSNEVVYAGWTPVRFRVTIDPNGGELPLTSSKSATYFKINYDELITEYGDITRTYYPNDSGSYVYACFDYSKAKSLDLDLDPAYRKAFYIKYTELEEKWNESFEVNGVSYCYKDVMTFDQFKQFINMNRHYDPTEGTVEGYQLLSWHRVRSNGTVESTPFNFSMRITEDTRLQARWMRIGKYSLIYNPMMSSTGITGSMSRYNDPLESDRKFSDGAQAVVLQEPTDIKLADGSDATEYIFRGWRIVDGQTHEPKEDNVFYDPGDTVVIDAQYADSQGVIHMEAYYEKKASTIRRVDVTSLILNANSDTAYVNGQGLANDKYEYVDIANKQIKIERQNNNFDVDLSRYIKNITNTDGSFLLGWDSSIPPDDYIPEYYADAFIGVNKENMPNNLYALWEPMVYLTIKNTTDYDMTFKLAFTSYSGTVYAGHTNAMTGIYERQKFSADDDVNEISTGIFSATLKKGETVQLVLPEGENAQYTVSGSYDISECGNKNLIVYNSGAENSVELNKDGNYTTSGTMIKGAEGQLVMFTNTNPETKLNIKARYYDLNNSAWQDGTPSTGANATIHFSLPSGYTETSSDDGSNVTVSMINNNSTTKFGVNVANFNETDYKFIGWYKSGEAAPNAYSIDGHASDFGEETVTGLAVPTEETTYYALFVPYVSGDLTIQHNELSGTAGHCAEGDGLKLDVYYTCDEHPGGNFEVSDTGDVDDPATVTIGENRINERYAHGTLKVVVSAKPHEGSIYKTTYRNMVEIPESSISRDEEGGYSTATFEAPITDRFVDSDSVKGLKEIRTVSYSSVFTRGYTITYNYTARNGQPVSYELSGSADTFDDFEEFVIEHTPYIRTLQGIVWDTQNIKIQIDENGMSAQMDEIETFRDKCSVVFDFGSYQASEKVQYGSVFNDDQKEKYTGILSEFEAKQSGMTFDYWIITNTDTGVFVANCYSRGFTFAVWNNYTVTPHYSENPVSMESNEQQSVTIDYIDTSRNQWGQVEQSDTKAASPQAPNDKLVADIDISFIDGDKKILDNPEGYKLGVVFEICGSVSEKGLVINPDDYKSTESTQEVLEKRVNGIIEKTKTNGTATDEFGASKTGYYYSRIDDINEDTVSSFNRSEFARSFTTSSVKNRVFRLYAYMKTPDGKIVVSNYHYFTMYDYSCNCFVTDL